MPAIASLEDLKSAQRDFRSKFLAVTPDDLPACSKPWRRQAPHDLRLRMTLCAMFTRRSLGVGMRYLSSIVPQDGT
jgi:hypothetical protein